MTSPVHDHAHDHEPDAVSGLSPEYQSLAIAIQELLIEKGILTAAAIHHTIEKLESATPTLGAKVVARAWVNAEFRARLLQDANSAVAELGIDMEGTPLVVVENTPEVHNLVVCTLCSCYPRPILGFPPAWYKSVEYRSRAVREPRAVLAEFGTVLPDSVQIRVHDSSANMRYLVLPLRPEGTEALSEEDLAQRVTRDSMIGVVQLHRSE